MDECDDLTHAAALIYYYTGTDPDTMDDDEFLKAYTRIEYGIRKAGRIQ